MSGTIPSSPPPPSRPPVTFREALRFWAKLGCINFGGPTGQIAIMHQELVERRRWISDERFLHALNYCMILPGPEAQQLATYVGWLLHRVAGGLAAGTLFVLPGFCLMIILSWLQAACGELAWLAAVFGGLRAAVIAIVAAAVIRIGKRALGNRVLGAVAALSFGAIFFLRLPFPAIILAAATVGFFGGMKWPGIFRAGASKSIEGGDSRGSGAILDAGPSPEHARASLPRACLTLAVGLAAWWGPLAAVIALRGTKDTLSQEAVFFSKAAMVTFGGAYAVLAYIQQQAVETYGWLERGQMITGLGLAESTPGPLILVTEFIGFLGAYRRPGGLPPALAGFLGACVTTWATFAPCFLWIFLGAPFIERLRGNRHLTATLSAITAAVVGVMLNLAIWCAIHTLFARVREIRTGGITLPVPDLASLDPFALAVAAVSFWGIRRRGWGIIPVILASAAAGLGYWLLLAGIGS